jgi:hypothetical protein
MNPITATFTAETAESAEQDLSASSACSRRRSACFSSRFGVARRSAFGAQAAAFNVVW